MIIQQMFRDDINRKINGVVKVDQSDSTTEQEVREYVITRELKKHFMTFFNYYADAFDTPTDDIGVWISGFFGSGKSHFEKMLSYLLENRQVGGKSTVEWFRSKFDDDPGTFYLIEKATKGPTETILFNIDIEGPVKKDKTAVLRVFAKMFYNHLGFYGENLKVVAMEKYIESMGKTDEFRRIFEQKKGKPWIEQRKAFAFNSKPVIETLHEVLGIPEQDARAWFADKSEADFSIAQLVDDIKAYVAGKPKNFRLLFMVDEVGQYVGTDTDLLLNLQSLLEKIGSDCGGKVWVVCTGQEAIDEIIKVRSDEFSRIQARFHTQLSLSSSSVDEVIQKRVLKKTPDAQKSLEALYGQRDADLRNLFSFENSVLDIKGYAGSQEFADDFPFVPYQFLIMQKVFAEIRKHGHAGKHLSGGERSMLSGFQEAAQAMQKRDEYALVPFYHFYDTVHSFLDGAIRRVVERCEKAAMDSLGLLPEDVNVLKLLYLILYIDEIKANLDNLVILMADDIRTDKINLRVRVQASLDRLLAQNYIARFNDAYRFLTDDEQDIERDIRNTPVDSASVVKRIGDKIEDSIYTTKKFRYGINDFPFDLYVDQIAIRPVIGGMKLRFLTVATDEAGKEHLRLMVDSKAKEAIVVLGDTPYYSSLEQAMKIDKCIREKNRVVPPMSIQKILESKRSEAEQLEKDAGAAIADAIICGQYYVDGEQMTDIRTGDAKSRIDQALQYLVTHVYTYLDLVRKHADNDDDIRAVLTEITLDGTHPNVDAAAKLAEYLDIQAARKLNTSMADVQSRYQGIPYGWRESDIAAVTALLIAQQKVVIKRAGCTIRPSDPRLVDMLRKKSEIGNTLIEKKDIIDPIKLKQARQLMREYLPAMDVPADQDGFIAFAIERLSGKQREFEDILSRYTQRSYPDKNVVTEAIAEVKAVLASQKDDKAFIDCMLDHENGLMGSKDNMDRVISFFDTQRELFDKAVKLHRELSVDHYYTDQVQTLSDALRQIRQIITVQDGVTFNYQRIPELNALIQTVQEEHGKLLQAKRNEVLEIVRQCMESIHKKKLAHDELRDVLQPISDTADVWYTRQKKEIASIGTISLLESRPSQLEDYASGIHSKMEKEIHPGKKIKRVSRDTAFPAKELNSEAEIDAYVEQIRTNLKQQLTGCNAIKIQ